MAANKSACDTHSADEKGIQAAEMSSCRGDIYKKSTAQSAFFVSLYEFRQILKQDCLDKLTQVDISKTAGKKWRKMSECQKQPYKLLALKNRVMMKAKTKNWKPSVLKPRLCFNCLRKEVATTWPSRSNTFS
uniref:HMG box domain-containing protein n=1 Tax=Glossina palpalis gambiensis TaxID=67801 RepID=A0A1B0AUW6_9MUSC